MIKLLFVLLEKSVLYYSYA